MGGALAVLVAENEIFVCLREELQKRKEDCFIFEQLATDCYLNIHHTERQ